ncbi:hypothetical protein ACFQZ4_42440 [Catellatospora coxensis]
MVAGSFKGSGWAAADFVGGWSRTDLRVDERGVVVGHVRGSGKLAGLFDVSGTFTPSGEGVPVAVAGVMAQVEAGPVRGGTATSGTTTSAANTAAGANAGALVRASVTSQDRTIIGPEALGQPAVVETVPGDDGRAGNPVVAQNVAAQNTAIPAAADVSQPVDPGAATAHDGVVPSTALSSGDGRDTQTDEEASSTEPQSFRPGDSDTQAGGGDTAGVAGTKETRPVWAGADTARGEAVPMGGRIGSAGSGPVGSSGPVVAERGAAVLGPSVVVPMLGTAVQPTVDLAAGKAGRSFHGVKAPGTETAVGGRPDAASAAPIRTAPNPAEVAGSADLGSRVAAWRRSMAADLRTLSRFLRGWVGVGAPQVSPPARRLSEEDVARRYPWLAGVNPWRGIGGEFVTNCVMSAIVADMTWRERGTRSFAGYQAPASAQSAVLDLVRYADEVFAGGPGFIKVRGGVDEIAGATAAAPGSRGVLGFGTRDSGWHVVNVFNDGGRAVFLDAQAGAWARLPTGGDFFFLPLTEGFSALTGRGQVMRRETLDRLVAGSVPDGVAEVPHDHLAGPSEALLPLRIEVEDKKVVWQPDRNTGLLDSTYVAVRDVSRPLPDGWSTVFLSNIGELGQADENVSVGSGQVLEVEFVDQITLVGQIKSKAWGTRFTGTEQTVHLRGTRQGSDASASSVSSTRTAPPPQDTPMWEPGRVLWNSRFRHVLRGSILAEQEFDPIGSAPTMAWVSDMVKKATADRAMADRTALFGEQDRLVLEVFARFGTDTARASRVAERLAAALHRRLETALTRWSERQPRGTKAVKPLVEVTVAKSDPGGYHGYDYDLVAVAWQQDNANSLYAPLRRPVWAPGPPARPVGRAGEPVGAVSFDPENQVPRTPAVLDQVARAVQAQAMASMREGRPLPRLTAWVPLLEDTPQAREKAGELARKFISEVAKKVGKSDPASPLVRAWVEGLPVRALMAFKPRRDDGTIDGDLELYSVRFPVLNGAPPSSRPRTRSRRPRRPRGGPTMITSSGRTT